ncbi:hypothetical protein [Streptomyces goshikiensis]|uniref:hypothetical protein n=1 Tax=Streptomyces goshikiensis TaxID=1942 RepID=UPI003662CA37
MLANLAQDTPTELVASGGELAWRRRTTLWGTDFSAPTKGTDFKIHAYDKSGREVGIFGSDGWFNKHNTIGADVEVPPSVETALQGRAVDTMRRAGRIGPRGTEGISGDKWRRPRLAAEGCK